MDKVEASVTPIDREWMTEIWVFLEKGSLPEDSTNTRKLKKNVNYYVIEGGNLCKSYMVFIIDCNSIEIKFSINFL